MVKDWFRDWKTRHRATVPLGFGQWPDDRGEGWDVFFKAFIAAKATEDTGRAVTDLMAENPPRDMADATRAFKAALDKVLEKKGASGGMDRDEALARSKNCPCCGGLGIASYAVADGRLWQCRTVGGIEYEARTTEFCCHLCPMGRWVLGRTKDFRDAMAWAGVAVGPDGRTVGDVTSQEEPAEVDEPRDVRAELRRGINHEFSPARAG